MKNLDLTGYMLISTNVINSSTATDNVILVFNKSSTSLGLILNKPIHDICLATLLSQMDLRATTDVDLVDTKLYFGGPEEISKGFVIHEEDNGYLNTIRVCKGIYITSSMDVMRDISLGSLKGRYMVIVGIVEWRSGDLEREISSNMWITCKASADLIFDANFRTHRNRILNVLGIAQNRLSHYHGNA